MIPDRILGEIFAALERPTEVLPSTRCVSRPALTALIGEIVRSSGLPRGRQPSAAAVIEHLASIRLVHEVPLTDPGPRVGAGRLLAIGLGVDPADLHPYEVLMAHAPDGVLCYSTAFQVHELTTQQIGHHHIAKPETAPSRLPSDEADSLSRARVSESDRPQPMGRAQFWYGGLPYYLAKRAPAALRSHQRRVLNERSEYRTTTLEQTLLDSLHRPMQCGGPAVVFEAWETAAQRIDVVAMDELVLRLQDVALARRAAHMVDRYGLAAGAETLALASTDQTPIALLHGIPYRRFDKRWRMLVS